MQNFLVLVGLEVTPIPLGPGVKPDTTPTGLGGNLRQPWPPKPYPELLLFRDELARGGAGAYRACRIGYDRQLCTVDSDR